MVNVSLDYKKMLVAYDSALAANNKMHRPTRMEKRVAYNLMCGDD